MCGVVAGDGGRFSGHRQRPARGLIVPTLRVGMHPVTLRVTILEADAERPERRSHAERGNDH
ncbi:hypothetical protein C1X27_16375 [Pseudomonas sp. MPR-AND1B]|nr:hypothetical protein C1X26_24110 [Pseudomonas sp. MPR-R3A]PMY97080.1 hypothetical protein C1X24_17160 [Pseudomonas sp. FW305-124]PMZ70756.1 hypothetical protein C1X25_15180 [Pseudomonas sp. GW247-3R2A]PNA88118.1 hypothetical protein C1X23_24865 [Pseudomonas sp. FW300-E2]PNB01382.1 hypothetical protein C1X27_16375 [Pseudomonas sp. MPR-AND1B]PRW66567.1 hypothetical protein C7A09_22880 [Pseudomonas fluorescens]RZI26934.1 hypothetical protein EUX58_05205 [Pseudomonas sp. 770NI]